VARADLETFDGDATEVEKGSDRSLEKLNRRCGIGRALKADQKVGGSPSATTNHVRGRTRGMRRKNRESRKSFPEVADGEEVEGKGS
jgi:hypothetical protein